MKRLLFMLLLLVGCAAKPKPAATVSQPKKAPCAPNVTQEAQESRAPVRPMITEKNMRNASWDDTHEVRCPSNMRTVLPSDRELAGHEDNFDEWYAEHEYCIPDGEGKP